MNLKQLQHFIWVAEELSFRKAAELAGLSQPALSHSIKSLETEFCLSLFERDKKKVKLTVMGEALLNRARRVLFESENLEQELNWLKTGQTGHVIVGVSPGFAVAFLADIIANWREISMQTSLKTVINSPDVLLKQLIDEELEVAVIDRRVIKDMSMFDLIDLPEESSAVFCRQGHPILDLPESARSFETLLSYGFVSQALPDDLRPIIVSMMNMKNPEQRIVACEIDNIHLCAEIAATSNMVLPTNKSSVKKWVDNGELIELPFNAPPPLPTAWSITTLKGRFLQPTAVEFLNSIKEVAYKSIAD